MTKQGTDTSTDHIPDAGKKVEELLEVIAEMRENVGVCSITSGQDIFTPDFARLKKALARADAVLGKYKDK